LSKKEAYLQANHFVAWLAMKHHRTHRGNMMDFKTRPYMLQIFMDNDEKIVMKSTQCGLTEYLITLAFSLALAGKSIFYVLPTLDLVGRFVRNRVNRCVNYSPYYQQLIDSKDENQSNTMSLKHIGNGTIAFVGSNTQKPFTEFPADIVIIDEKDQCNQANINMAWERMSASLDRRQFYISNPTILKYGIHEDWIESSQSKWHIKGECGHYIQPDFFKHVVNEIGEGKYEIVDPDFNYESGQDIRLICDKCGKPVDRKSSGNWVSTYKGKKHGYHISKLFSTNVSIKELVDRFEKGLVNPTVMQRFYNADLGLPFTAKGSKISREMIFDCINPDYTVWAEKSTGVAIAGVDVGTYYNYVIKQMLNDGRLKTLKVGAIINTEDLIKELKKYNVKVGIIDGQPETREARKIANAMKNFYLCYYTGARNSQINAVNKTVSVDRTSALDAVKEALLLKKIIYPQIVEHSDDYLEQMTASTRVFDADKIKDGNRGVYDWQEGTQPDHYFHATAYCLIASRLLIMLMKR